MKLVIKEIKLNNAQKTFQRIFGDGVMTHAHTRLHAYCSDYVPMDSGALDQTVDITPECVHYKQPYARRQWEGKGIKYSTDKHPLVTSHWEVAAMAAHKVDLCRDIENYLRKK